MRARKVRKAIAARKVISCWREGLTVGEISRKVDNICRRTVLKILSNNGYIDSKKYVKSSDKMIDEAISLYKEGFSVRQIGKRLDVSHTHVYNILDENGIERRRSNDDVRRMINSNKKNILRDKRKGLTLVALADKYNVSRSSIVAALKRWKG